jgi:hypothetical protein
MNSSQERVVVPASPGGSCACHALAAVLGQVLDVSLRPSIAFGTRASAVSKRPIA